MNANPLGGYLRNDPRAKEQLRAEEAERDALAAEQRATSFDLESAVRSWMTAFGCWRRIILTAPINRRPDLLDRAQRAAGAAADISRRLQAKCLAQLDRGPKPTGQAA